MRAFAALACTVAAVWVLASVARAATALPTELAQDEVDALLSLYDTLDGAEWVDIYQSGGWANRTTDPCTWEGVRCTDAGTTPRHVDWLYLSVANLKGPFPSTALLKFTELTSLDMGTNPGLYGTLPDNFGDLTKLTGLYLEDSSGLTGSLPDSFGNMVTLENVQLANCGLSGPLPDSMAGMTSLVSFSAPSNGFTGALPAWVKDLTQLISLDLTNNKFEDALPTQWPAGLAYIMLSGNRLSGSLEGLEALENLRTVELQGNCVTVDDAATTWCSQLNDCVVVPQADDCPSGGDPGKDSPKKNKVVPAVVGVVVSLVVVGAAILVYLKFYRGRKDRFEAVSMFESYASVGDGTDTDGAKAGLGAPLHTSDL